MNTIIRGFLISAVIYGVLGMLLGLHMAISEDHGQLPTHAHIMVIGWVSFAIFGMFYKLFANAVHQGLAKAHFWLAQISFPALAIALWLLYSGNEAGDSLAGISSIAYAISFLVFAVAAFRAVGSES